VIAHLGTSSDEFLEELQYIAEELDDMLSSQQPGCDTPPVLLAVDFHQLSDLFAPNDVPIVALPGLLLWVVDAGSAQLWLRASEPLLAAISRAEAYRINGRPIQQHVLLHIELSSVGSGESVNRGEMPSPAPPPGTADFVHLLTAAGVSVGAIPDDGIFLAEVCRPDAVITALRMTSLLDLGTSDGQGAFQGALPVARAPRLLHLTRAAIEHPGERTRRELFRELSLRKVALLVITDRTGAVCPMTWSGHRSALPVYPDLNSLFQAADDLKIERASLAWAGMAPGVLFGWVTQEQLEDVALNAYKDRATPEYLFLAQHEISELAHGRIPSVSAAVSR